MDRIQKCLDKSEHLGGHCLYICHTSVVAWSHFSEIIGFSLFSAHSILEKLEAAKAA